jgi:hypothetical protein
MWAEKQRQCGLQVSVWGRAELHRVDLWAGKRHRFDLEANGRGPAGGGLGGRRGGRRAWGGGGGESPHDALAEDGGVVAFFSSRRFCLTFVGDYQFCLASTMRDANQGMHPTFCFTLLKSVLKRRQRARRRARAAWWAGKDTPWVMLGHGMTGGRTE